MSLDFKSRLLSRVQTNNIQILRIRTGCPRSERALTGGRPYPVRESPIVVKLGVFSLYHELPALTRGRWQAEQRFPYYTENLVAVLENDGVLVVAEPWVRSLPKSDWLTFLERFPNVVNLKIDRQVELKIEILCYFPQLVPKLFNLELPCCRYGNKGPLAQILSNYELSSLSLSFSDVGDLP